MAHWSQDFDAFLELEALYEQKRQEWSTMKHGPDGPSGEQNFTTTAEERKAAHNFRRNEVNLLAEEFAKARDYWRSIGESLDDDHPQKRTPGVSVRDFVDDNGNGIDDREETAKVTDFGSDGQ